MSKRPQPAKSQPPTEHNTMSAKSDPTLTEVGGVAPVYFSVEEAQSATKGFNSQQGTEYTVPGTLDPPNEYDIVTDKQREVAAYTFKQENILYADNNAAQEMRHQTLTMERIGKHRFSGRATSADVTEPKEGCCHGCKTRHVCLGLFICLILALAVAAIVLVVLVIVQVIPVCNCTATSTEVQQLQEIVNTLSRKQSNTSTNVDGLSQRLDMFDVTPQVETAIAARITEAGTIIGVNYSAILQDFNPYSDCVTKIERRCTMTTAVGNNRCETPDLEYISQTTEFTYTRDVRCMREPLSLEQNPIVSTLVVQGNIVFCLCHRIIETTSPLTDVSCALQTTRCKPSRDIPVDIVTTASRT